MVWQLYWHTQGAPGLTRFVQERPDNALSAHTLMGETLDMVPPPPAPLDALRERLDELEQRVLALETPPPRRRNSRAKKKAPA